MIPLAENLARTFPAKPSKRSAKPVAYVYVVMIDHDWFTDDKPSVTNTQKIAEMIAAERVNELRAMFIESFDLAEKDVPKANCTTYRETLSHLRRYDNTAEYAVIVHKTELFPPC
jgi:hypothetical protein